MPHIGGNQKIQKKASTWAVPSRACHVGVGPSPSPVSAGMLLESTPFAATEWIDLSSVFFLIYI